MKSILRFSLLVVTVIVLSFSGAVAPWVGMPARADKLEDTNFVKVDNSKIDLNNANISAFRRLPGMYPTIARILVANAPYSSVDEVFAIPSLTEAQKQRIKENLNEFTLKQPDASMNRERINNATYRL